MAEDNAMMIAAREKLATRFNNVRCNYDYNIKHIYSLIFLQNRTGGKGSVRRKKKTVHKTASGDDKKLGSTMKKLGAAPIAGVEEVNLFQDDGRILHIASPKVEACISANTFAVTGKAEIKSLQALLPGILNQLGPDNMANLKQLAQSMQGMGGVPSMGTGVEEEDDDDMPELVENFEAVSQQD